MSWDNPFAIASSKRRELGMDRRVRVRRRSFLSFFGMHYGPSPSPFSLMPSNERNDDPFGFPFDSNMTAFNIRTESVDEGDDGDIDIDDEATSVSVMVSVAMKDKLKEMEIESESEEESEDEATNKRLNERTRIPTKCNK